AMVQSGNAQLHQCPRGRHEFCRRRFRVKRQFLQMGFPRCRSSASESKANVKLTKVLRGASCVTSRASESLFVESRFNKFLQLLHRLIGVWSVAAETQL